MAKTLRCPCGHNAGCKLCSGTGLYSYTPSSLGWQPFTCPTCDGTRRVTNGSGEIERCFTCQGKLFLDPADHPSGTGLMGSIRAAWITVFGG